MNAERGFTTPFCRKQGVALRHTPGVTDTEHHPSQFLGENTVQSLFYTRESLSEVQESSSTAGVT